MNMYYLNACYLVLFAYSVFSDKDIEDGFLSWISFSFLLFRQCDSLLDFLFMGSVLQSSAYSEVLGRV